MNQHLSNSSAQTSLNSTPLSAATIPEASRCTFFKQLTAGDPGLKVLDLEHASPYWQAADIKLVPGLVLGHELFSEFVEANKQAIKDLEDKSKFNIDKFIVPYSLIDACQTVLSIYPDTVLAVRSSARNERGGIGIYESHFFVPTRRPQGGDCGRLASCCVKTLLSWFAPKASAYQAKHPGEDGMGLLIQPVPGIPYGNYYLPLLSGNGYIRHDGKPFIRVVPGLGTKAVNDSAALFHGNLPTEKEIWTKIGNQDTAHALNPEGQVEVIKIDQDFFAQVSISPIKDLFHAINSMAAKGQNEYFEWVVEKCGESLIPRILQSAPWQDAPLKALQTECPGAQLFMQGNDIIGHADVLFQKVIWVLVWDKEVRDILWKLNTDNRNYLLVVPQEATSSTGFFGSNEDPRVQYHHFSNAAVVSECFWDTSAPGVREMLFQKNLTAAPHIEGLAGQHLGQLCARENIPFLGAPMPRLETRPDRYIPPGIAIFNCAGRAVIDQTKKLGRIFLFSENEIEEFEFAPSQINEFSHELRHTANRLNDERANPALLDLADCFYHVHYALPSMHEEDWGQFKLDQNYVKEVGIEEVKRSLDVVLTQGAPFLDDDVKEFLLKLQQALANKT